MNAGGSNGLRIAFVGDSSLLIRCADCSIRAGLDIRFIVSSSKDVVRWAESKGITSYPTLQDVSCSGEDIRYLFSIGHLKVIPQDILHATSATIINFHDGPLPNYAGLQVTSWALLGGESIHAVSWHRVEEKVDSGAICATRDFPIAQNETSFSLNLKCFDVGFALFEEKLLPAIIADKLEEHPQDGSLRKVFTRHQKPSHAGIIDWEWGAKKIQRVVQALTFGGYDNLLASAKIRLADEWYIIVASRASDEYTNSQPGTIVEVANEMAVSCSDGAIILEQLVTLEAEPVSFRTALGRHGIAPGDFLAASSPNEIAAMRTSLVEASATEYRFLAAFSGEAVFPRQAAVIEDSLETTLSYRNWLHLGDDVKAVRGNLQSAIVSYFGLLQKEGRLAVLLDSVSSSTEFRSVVSPFLLTLTKDSCLSEVTEQVAERQSFSKDFVSRHPTFESRLFSLAVVDASTLVESYWQPEIVVQVDVEQARFRLVAPKKLDNVVARYEAELLIFVTNALQNQSVALCELSILTPEGQALIDRVNATQTACEHNLSIHEQFVARAQSANQALAVVFQDEQCTYAELDQQSAAVAYTLKERGVGPGDAVGICVDRSIKTVVAVLGVLKAGAAYVPMDPDYPLKRLEQMIVDASVKHVVVDSNTKPLWSTHPELSLIDVTQAASQQEGFIYPTLLDQQPDALAYIMFTSGSTGRPKGVMVSHANVSNFFSAMDKTVGLERGSTWLAVTSLSFDISVLELLWTLSRGMKVILYHPSSGITQSGSARNDTLDFSLSYFASETDEFRSQDGYQLLYDGVAFADANGFTAVWTPERHFHSFGGLFPNPSVVSAAIAARTKNLQIRAGSVVAPLHHPIRIAEDWALVDQLSNGRVGVSFASGWQENDFVLAPENYHDRKDIIFDSIKRVQSLWAGREETFSGVDDKPVTIAIKPLPQQQAIPVWVTAAGNPETFRRAGEAGVYVLTHLLGQRVPEFSEKVKIYRDAWKAAGHAGNGHVTLLVHTFVGTETNSVRDLVRKPLSDYLKTAVGLIKNAPYAFPTFKKPSAAIAAKVESGIKDFTEEEIEQLTDFAFDRYFENSGLFGTPQQCIAKAKELHAAGADELACLIDFGVCPKAVVESLPLLKSVKDSVQRELRNHRYCFTSLLQEHAVNGIQATPSFYEMLSTANNGLNALRGVDKVLVGGEPLQQSLVEKMRPVITGQLLNMYGPTETCIWSTVADVSARQWDVDLGYPIANTAVYVLDHHGRLLNPGSVGELYIAGAGVTAGYVGQEQLSAERFVDIVLPNKRRVRAYKTGDLVVQQADGSLDFIGREDGQVKVSGYRIELRDIEIALSEIPGVSRAVVVLDKAGEVPQLKAFFTAETELDKDCTMRSLLAQRLPEYMLPTSIQKVENFPLTPNGKVDKIALLSRVAKRKILPKPVEDGDSPLEHVKAVWQEVLPAEVVVDVDTNLFDLGANSLMVVQAAVQLKEILKCEVALVDIFQNPSIRAFVNNIVNQGRDDQTLSTGSAERAGRRKAFLSRRTKRR